MHAWNNFLEDLERSYGKETIDTWVRTLKTLRFDACNIYLEALDTFQISWVEEHVLPKTKLLLKNNNGHPIRVHLYAPGWQKKQEEALPTVSPTLKFSPDIVYPHATFEQFIPNPENAFTYGALCRLVGFDPATGSFVEPPSQGFNPIYIYGPSGSGKTHLLMAAATYLHLRGFKVFYVRAETFTEHVVGAIRSSKMDAFRKAYREVDVLIIDDVQVLGRKNATQEELFHTFNTLHTAGKQIILSAHVNPRLLEYVEERLISRFEWGINLSLERTIGGTYLHKILSKRLPLHRLQIKKNTYEFLLKRFSNASSLSRAIETIASEYPTATNIDLPHVQPILDRLLDQEKRERLNEEKILEHVAHCFGIKIEDILSKSQTRECVLPRQIAMYLLRKELNLPYQQIGRLFKRDHSTVMSAIKQVAKGLETNSEEITYHLTSISSAISR